MTRHASIQLTLLICLIAGSASAESRVTVRPFFGPHAVELRREVVSVLSSHRELTLIPTEEIEEQADQLGVDPNSPAGRLALSSSLHVAAWMEAIVQRRGGKLRATVLVFEGQKHRRVARSVVVRSSPRALSKALRLTLWRLNRDALLSASAPEQPAVEEEKVKEVESAPTPEEAPEVPEPPAPVAEPTPAAEPMVAAVVAPVPRVAASREPKRDALLATLGLGTLSRSFRYRDPQTQSLGDYRLPVAPQASLGVRYYPGAHFSAGWPSYLGLDLQAQVSLAPASKTRSGDKYATWADAYGLGGRVRIPVRTHELSLLYGYGVRRFSFKDQKKKPSPTPDVNYRFLRSGAELDFALGDKLHLGGSGAFLWMLSGGELTSSRWFPRSAASGLEAACFGSYRLTKHLDLVAGVGLAHFFLQFHAKKADARVARGAADDFITGELGVRLRL